MIELCPGSRVCPTSNQANECGISATHTQSGSSIAGGQLKIMSLRLDPQRLVLPPAFPRVLAIIVAKCHHFDHAGKLIEIRWHLRTQIDQHPGVAPLRDARTDVDGRSRAHMGRISGMAVRDELALRHGPECGIQRLHGTLFRQHNQPGPFQIGLAQQPAGIAQLVGRIEMESHLGHGTVF